MNKPLTLGSLFDGSGGFPLGGLLCGIEPVWASEIEPFPIRVTTKRMPGVQHYGDICKIDGAKIPPTDIVTFGSPCQSFSLAGKREGMQGKSGLFYEAVRVIREMYIATNRQYPTFAVMENVPGIFSSKTNGKSDFLEVLNELISIKDKALSVPLPEKGKWSTSGEIVGDGFSLGWRTVDAQFWGVAQRRRRCYIVLDLAGERAGKILFDETRLRGNPPQSGFAGQATAGTAPISVGGAVCILNDQGGSFMDISEDITGTLRSQEHGHQPIVFEPGALARLDKSCSVDKTFCLRADPGDNAQAVCYPINTQVGLRNHKDGDGTGFGIGDDGDAAYTLQSAHAHAVAIENRPQDSRIKINENGIVQTLDARMGMGGGNVPLVMNERQYALTVSENVANTLTSTDYKGTQCVFEPKVYGICSQASNSMLSNNPKSGIYEAETARTLDTGGGRPDCHQGGLAVVFDSKQVTSKDNRSNPQPGAPCHTLASGSADSAVCVQGSMIGRAEKNGLQGDGINEGMAFTLNTVDRHAVCYQDVVGTLDTGLAKQNSNQIVDAGGMIVEQVSYAMTTGSYMQVCEEKSPTLQARDYKDAPAVSRSQYIVRRLTPIECALLQGFPPTWCAGLETPEPTEEDIAFWSDVFETHRKIMGTSSKPKSRNQIVKWLQDPHSDAAEYKMWGNGVCLNNVVFVLGGIVWALGL